MPNGDKLTYSLGLPTTPDLTSGGKPIIWEQVSPNLLIGRIDGGDDMPSREIIRFEITNPNTGAFEVEIKGPVDHPDEDAEDVIHFDVPVTVKDPRGGSATANVKIEVEDDSPAPFRLRRRRRDDASICSRRARRRMTTPAMVRPPTSSWRALASASSPSGAFGADGKARDHLAARHSRRRRDRHRAIGRYMGSSLSFVEA